eukprot:TRINITY_DN3632_c0_g1_i2.p1 TRINITY_DN3632_c0_g1~~TRINITY_DN3632_c0_g1_i2.p1  ORF type:complete len:992 (-),score=211.91 TRINITY_DN3632_c0_g1_i2:80-3025(-)
MDEAILIQQDLPSLRFDPPLEALPELILDVKEDVYKIDFKPYLHHNFVVKEGENMSVISVLDNVSTDGRSRKALETTKKGYQLFDLIFETGDNADISLVSQMETAIKKHKSSPTVPSSCVIHPVNNNLQFASQFMMLEEKHPQKKVAMKLGVILCKSGQVMPSEMFQNQMEDDFKLFMQGIGSEINLEIWKGYRGDMSSKEGTTYYSLWNGPKTNDDDPNSRIDVIYHVAPLLNAEGHRRLIGNDIGIIIFLERGAPPFDPSKLGMLGTVPQVFVVVQPYHNMYKIASFSNINIKSHHPFPPKQPLFFNQMKNFILTKLYNGIVMCNYCPPISRLFYFPRNETLESIISKFLPSLLNVSSPSNSMSNSTSGSMSPIQKKDKKQDRKTKEIDLKKYSSDMAKILELHLDQKPLELNTILSSSQSGNTVSSATPSSTTSSLSLSSSSNVVGPKTPSPSSNMTNYIPFDTTMGGDQYSHQNAIYLLLACYISSFPPATAKVLLSDVLGFSSPSTPNNSSTTISTTHSEKFINIYVGDDQEATTLDAGGHDNSHQKSMYMIISDENKTIIVFRSVEGHGSDSQSQKDTSDTKTISGMLNLPAGSVRKDFISTLTISLWSSLIHDLQKIPPKSKIYLGGFSTGAVLATIVAYLLMNNSIEIESLYTFGSPKVGDKTWSKSFDEKLMNKTFRLVHELDHIPYMKQQHSSEKHKHVGTIYFITQEGEIEKNYSVADLKNKKPLTTRFHNIETYLSGLLPYYHSSLMNPKYSKSNNDSILDKRSGSGSSISSGNSVLKRDKIYMTICKILEKYFEQLSSNSTTIKYDVADLSSSLSSTYASSLLRSRSARLIHVTSDTLAAANTPSTDSNSAPTSSDSLSSSRSGLNTSAPQLNNSAVQSPSSPSESPKKKRAQSFSKKPMYKIFNAKDKTEKVQSDNVSTTQDPVPTNTNMNTNPPVDGGQSPIPLPIKTRKLKSLSLSNGTTKKKDT